MKCPNKRGVCISTLLYEAGITSTVLIREVSLIQRSFYCRGSTVARNFRLEQLFAPSCHK